ncbi:hypothetical protein D3C87_1720690 [compost metagenome]
MPLTAFYHRSKDVDRRVAILTKYVLQDLVFAHALHLLARIVRESISSTRIQQTHKIVDLSNGTYCRTRVFTGRLLFNGNNRAQARHLIHIRPFHSAHKLPGISAESLHIPPLPLGINGIKSK